MTIRRPTPHAFAFAWWLTAIAGGDPETTDEPQCGFFKRRLVRNGPWVSAKIWLDQWIDADTGELMADERLQCEVDGRWADAEDQWQWLCGNPITEAEFNYLTASIAWTRQHAPHEPMADPRRAVDWLAVPVPTF